uniref:SLC2A4 regulator n=1 Tax=Sphenodon punctatus TaxID=8508 RepID=A0A8D0HI71_SPHPU
MDPKRLAKRSAPPESGRIGSPPPGLTTAGPGSPGSSPPTAAAAATAGLYCGRIQQSCKPPLGSAPAAGNAVYTVLLGDALLRRRRQQSAEDGAEGKSPSAKGRLKQPPKSPIHCNGKALPEEAELVNGRLRRLTDPLALNGRLEESSEEAATRRLLEQSPLLHSAYIPVPRQRKLSGKAGIDEVMAAAVLTSLSTSPLVHGNPPSAFGTESSCDAWKEGPTMSSSYSSSNNSGDWNWDLPSDRSTPSTPSPPLSSADTAKSFLSSPQLDIEETEATHFLFGDPIPRKRKNSTKVMFKCLWKSCGKVLSSSSGMQRHIRTIHLGRKADLDQSDGEEDFYYTELDVNVDSLTDGLSSLTPVSPTSSVPPAFPILEEVQQPLPPAPVKVEVSVVSQLSELAPTSLCHVHTDHAYQGCLPPIRPAGVGEKRPQISHLPIAKTHSSGPPSVPKPAVGTRKPRGEAKKCRKVYGMENRDMWCTSCRWKKACQRFVD